MCLTLPYAEAQLWKREARSLIAKAEKAAARMPVDPLFQSLPRISGFVSAIDSVKKRHGLLIEKALINAINKLPKWSAMKECVQTSNGQAHVDCLAHNSDTQQLYVFECKRGHGQFDGDRVRAIDSRLGRVATAIGPHAARKGWAVKSTDVFILSFYGRKWKSKYPIYDMTEIAKVFPPCLRTFAQEFARHSEFEVSQSYGREFSGVDISASDPRTVFDDIDEEQHPGEFVVFEEQSARIYRRPTAP